VSESLIPEAPADCFRLRAHGITLDCFLGVYEHEQRTARPVVVDVEMLLGINVQAVRDDRLDGTVNYEQVVQTAQRVAASRRFKLIETLCANLLDELWLAVDVRGLAVRVTKPQPMAGLSAASVELRRMR
jgi:dihydroneopterin aldolase